VVALGAAVVCLAAPAAYTLSTVAQAHGGAIPLAGPASTRGFGPGGARGGPGGAANGFPGGGANGFPGGAGRFGPNGGAGAAGGTGTPRGGAAGGLLDGSNPGADLTALLEQGSNGYRWAAAAVGANRAAGYQLASGEPIMAIGGFNGTDPAPTLAEFQRYVADGDIHYFVAGGSAFGGGGGGGFGGGGGRFGGGFGGPGGASGTSSEIAAWVEANFTSRTVDGVTVYDLTQQSV
jgi:hypothetical protein